MFNAVCFVSSSITRDFRYFLYPILYFQILACIVQILPFIFVWLWNLVVTLVMASLCTIVVNAADLGLRVSHAV